MQTLTKVLSLLLISATMATAVEAERFLRKLTLPSGLAIVVAEGDFEPRSTGSFSVRLYSGANPRFPTDDFLGGVIHERDGFVGETKLGDVDGDGSDELIVVVETAGSGGFLSAHAFSIGKKSLALRCSVADLTADADPVAALGKAAKGDK